MSYTHDADGKHSEQKQKQTLTGFCFVLFFCFFFFSFETCRNVAIVIEPQGASAVFRIFFTVPVKDDFFFQTNEVLQMLWLLLLSLLLLSLLVVLFVTAILVVVLV